MTTITPASHWEGTPPLVAFDMDGTLYDWGSRLNQILLGLDPHFPIIADEDRKDFNDLMGPGGDPSVLAAAMAHPDLYDGLEPYPGAIEAVLATVEAGYPAIILTTPDVSNQACAPAKQAQVRRDFGAAWDKLLIMSHDKTVVNAEILVDDKPEITGLHTPAWTRILPDHSWNRYVQQREIIMGSWQDWPTVLDETLISRGRRLRTAAAA